MQNDPVNFVDPSGLMPSDGCGADLSFAQCYGNSQWDPFFGGSLGGNRDGWGDDPHPGRNAIDIGNFRIDDWRNQVWYGAPPSPGSPQPDIVIHSWECFAGVCWYSGGSVYVGGHLPSDFDGPVIGGLNPLYHPLSWRTPNITKPVGPTEPTLTPTEPAPLEPGWKPTLRWVPGKGVRMLPEYDPNYVSPGASLMTRLGKAAVIFGRVVNTAEHVQSFPFIIMVNLPSQVYLHDRQQRKLKS